MPGDTTLIHDIGSYLFLSEGYSVHLLYKNKLYNNGKPFAYKLPFNADLATSPSNFNMVLKLAGDTLLQSTVMIFVLRENILSFICR